MYIINPTPSFQIIKCFGFSRYITLAMHLDICTMFRNIVKIMYLEKLKPLIISNGKEYFQLIIINKHA